MQPAPRYAWLNGEIVPWDRCVLHGRSQGAFWGANVFEGLKAHWVADAEEAYLFRVEDHLARLRRSMKSLRLEIPYTDADLRDACLRLLRANELRQDAHVVIVAYFGMGPNFDGLSLTDDTGVHITALPVSRSRAYQSGMSVCVSSWRRIGDDTMPPRVKTGANYHNSRLAFQEAKRAGCDTALILNQRGTLAEAPNACVVMVRDGRLVTPPGTAGVLEGITLDTILELARTELGLPVDVREIDRTELYVAGELFLCGTLMEILPVTSVDGLPVGDGLPGPVTRRLQAVYDGVTRTAPEHARWRTPVGAAEPVQR
jgi:branched-chain amino acid aminotransferase